MMATPFIRSSNATKGLNVAYHLDGSCNSQQIQGNWSTWLNLNMLAAEGSPLDLEEVHVYLSDPKTFARKSKFSNSTLLHPSEHLSTFAASKNNFTR
jgi:hypothetical protein